MHNSVLTKHILFALMLIISPVTNATPIVFNFTGIVSDHYLMEGVLQDSPFVHPEWNGMHISGSMMMDLQGVKPFAQNDYINWYLNYNLDNSEQWLKFIINAPDGTVHTIAGPREYMPSVFNNLSYAYLNQSSETSDFVVQRVLSKDPTNPSESLVRMGLMSTGENQNSLLSSLDFSTVKIQPEFANYYNFALVNYRDAHGKQFNYTFGLDSMTRVTSEVPEPGSMALMLLGFVGLLLNSRRKK